MTDTAPDFALPLGWGGPPYWVHDARGHFIVNCSTQRTAVALITAVNNAAARDAEIERLRKALGKIEVTDEVTG